MPLTREFLRNFYGQYPLEPVSAEKLNDYTIALESLRVALREVDMTAADRAIGLYSMETPTRIDDNFWRSRQICEEIAQHCMQLALSHRTVAAQQGSLWVECNAAALKTELAIRETQHLNTESVKKQMKQFIPQV